MVKTYFNGAGSYGAVAGAKSKIAQEDQSDTPEGKKTASLVPPAPKTAEEAPKQESGISPQILYP